MKKKLKDFILSHTAINHSELARLVEWNQTSMSLWLKGERDLPDKHVKKMNRTLKSYGFKNKL